MRTKEQELEFQVKDIFNEFYKERMVNEKVTSFTVEENELDGMLSIEIDKKNEGKFYHNDLDDEIFYKFIRRKDKFILIFIQLENLISGFKS